MKCIHYCFVVLVIFLPQVLSGIEISALNSVLLQRSAPFQYDLQIKVIPGQSQDEPVMVCCHGYGGDYGIADIIHSYGVVKQSLVGFNFPDHDINEKGFDPKKMTFCSIYELLPLIYVLKQIVVEGKADQVSLYGFSAGGGAIVNTIAVLNSSGYEGDLLRIGVDENAKRAILAAVQNGIIILDSPLKSMEELLETRERDEELLATAAQFKKNFFNPIQSLSKWNGLKLSVILFFQKPDEVLSNRYDGMFIDKMKKANPQGINIVVIRNEGGHNGYHKSLWRAYRALMQHREGVLQSAA